MDHYQVEADVEEKGGRSAMSTVATYDGKAKTILENKIAKVVLQPTTK